MVELALSIISLLILVALLVGVVYLALWVLGQLGVSIPAKIVQVIWIIVVLIVLYWLVATLFLGGPPFPRVFPR